MEKDVSIIVHELREYMETKMLRNRKVFYFNLNVGSGIEYIGDLIADWIKLVNPKFKNYKLQNPETILYDELLQHNPDIIILNEYYERTAVPTIFWKKNKPNTKIIFLPHVWQHVHRVYHTKNLEVYHKDRYLRELYSISDDIFMINWPPEGECQELGSKMHRAFPPMPPHIYENHISWMDRKGLFVYMGNIIPHKLSLEFIQKIRQTDITLHCYGRKLTGDDGEGYLQKNPSMLEYYKEFDACRNIIQHGLVPQDQVAQVLNEYKFFVMPHNGDEPFNCALQQSIMCGTIPLVVNDRTTRKYDPEWIDWADGLYYSNHTVDEFIENLVRINQEPGADATEESENISRKIRERFNYEKFKEEFIRCLSS